MNILKSGCACVCSLSLPPNQNAAREYSKQTVSLTHTLSYTFNRAKVSSRHGTVSDSAVRFRTQLITVMQDSSYDLLVPANGARSTLLCFMGAATVALTDPLFCFVAPFALVNSARNNLLTSQLSGKELFGRVFFPHSIWSSLPYAC